ncbi:SET domain-containing protein [Exidia glandulosa HHB12029]|uniref:SET domain-containing protein n=1 Tax=Exidia glandulosa HHB12029 TaxID=1314781 RepID=A0A165K518_EXIGL|nr:SET domain-containing protein [Exidia glandulosa HHB12029]
MADALWSRFENNNFVVHSHLDPVAAGVFVEASRSFNHSCAPNAVPLFVFSPGEPPRMEVVVVSSIQQGEEITIPYVDPALDVRTRQERLRTSYGFDCTCLRCTRELKHPALAPPVNDGALRGIYAQLSGEGQDLPSCVLHESFLPALAERFSASAHEGKYEEAIMYGDALRALYEVVYPAFYPLIALHLLELAKTTWNAALSSKTPDMERAFMDKAASYLRRCRTILVVLGEEGDVPHPLEEVTMLETLLKNEISTT